MSLLSGHLSVFFFLIHNHGLIKLESENAFKDKLKSLLRKVKEESEKAGLKLNIKKLRSWHLVPSLMASRWGTSGNSDRFYIPVLQNHCGW